MERIVLASSSPQRAEILKSLKLPFVAVAPNAEEQEADTGDPAELAMLNARLKLSSVAATLLQGGGQAPLSVLSADTVIGQGDRLFGKPKSRDDAARMLKAFSGNACVAATALCFFNGRTRLISSRASLTELSFMELTSRQVERYLDTGEWQGAAGGFRVQGIAACFITCLRGSCSGAAGLPVHLLYELLLENDCGFIV